MTESELRDQMLPVLKAAKHQGASEVVAALHAIAPLLLRIAQPPKPPEARLFTDGATGATGADSGDRFAPERPDTSDFSADDAPSYRQYFAADKRGRYAGDMHRLFGCGMKHFADTTGLVRKQVQVHRDGKTFYQWHWVSPEDAGAADSKPAGDSEHSQHVARIGERVVRDLSLSGRAKDAAMKAAAGVYHHVGGILTSRAADYAGRVLDALLDTPQDMLTKFGYNPTVSSGGAGPVTADPIRDQLGISTHVALRIASEILTRAFEFAKSRLSKSRQMASGGDDEVADIIANTVNAALESLLLPPANPTMIRRALHALGGRGFSEGTRQFADDTRITGPTHDEKDFHNSLIYDTTPGDRTAHLIYLDWLQEHGHAKLAEMIRSGIQEPGEHGGIHRNSTTVGAHFPFTYQSIGQVGNLHIGAAKPRRGHVLISATPNESFRDEATRDGNPFHYRFHISANDAHDLADSIGPEHGGTGHELKRYLRAHVLPDTRPKPSAPPQQMSDESESPSPLTPKFDALDGLTDEQVERVASALAANCDKDAVTTLLAKCRAREFAEPVPSSADEPVSPPTRRAPSDDPNHKELPEFVTKGGHPAIARKAHPLFQNELGGHIRSLYRAIHASDPNHPILPHLEESWHRATPESLEEVQSFIRGLNENGKRSLTRMGADPWAFEQLPDIAEHANAYLAREAMKKIEGKIYADVPPPEHEKFIEQLASPAHARTRAGGDHPDADHGLREQLASSLEGVGRGHEASYLRDRNRQVTVQGGHVTPAKYSLEKVRSLTMKIPGVMLEFAWANGRKAHSAAPDDASGLVEVSGRDGTKQRIHVTDLPQVLAGHVKPVTPTVTPELLAQQQTKIDALREQVEKTKPDLAKTHPPVGSVLQIPGSSVRYEFAGYDQNGAIRLHSIDPRVALQNWSPSTLTGFEVKSVPPGTPEPHWGLRDQLQKEHSLQIAMLQRAKMDKDRNEALAALSSFDPSQHEIADAATIHQYHYNPPQWNRTGDPRSPALGVELETAVPSQRTPEQAAREAALAAANKEVNDAHDAMVDARLKSPDDPELRQRAWERVQRATQKLDQLPERSPRGEKMNQPYFGTNEHLRHAATMTLDKLNAGLPKEGFAFLKRDGSIQINDRDTRRGFEIVTHPATLEVHKQRWLPVLGPNNEAQLSSNFDKHNTGLHVHVERDKLTELGVYKMLAFANARSNRDYIAAIARRNENQWAKFKDVKPSDATSRNEDRYEAINLRNPKTVEFRIFGGTLKPSEFFTSLEFADSLSHFARAGNHSANEATSADAFMAFVEQNQKRYPHLAAFNRAFRAKKGMPTKFAEPVASPDALGQIPMSVSLGFVPEDTADTQTFADPTSPPAPPPVVPPVSLRAHPDAPALWRDILGPQGDHNHVVGIMGGYSGGRINMGHEGDYVSILAKQPHPTNPGGLGMFELIRQLRKDPRTGKPYLKMGNIDVHPDFQGNGIGEKLFGSHLDFAEKAGIPEFRAHLARKNAHHTGQAPDASHFKGGRADLREMKQLFGSVASIADLMNKPGGPEWWHDHIADRSSDAQFNGYSTWGKFGYDQRFDEPGGVLTADLPKVAELKRLFPGVETLQQLLDTEAGQKWWHGEKGRNANGFDLLKGRFDATPGSESRKIYEAYRAKRAAKKAAETHQQGVA